MKAIVLSSGGVDSTTALALAIEKHGASNVSTLSVTYGQKHQKELECAEKIANYYGVNHSVIDLTSIYANNSTCTLIQGNGEIEHESYAKQQENSETGIVNTYVPFRNGLIIAVATALAMNEYPNCEVELYLGAHADDATGNAYPDCSEAFTTAMYEAVKQGTGNFVKPLAPFVNMTKAQVVKKGLELNVPYELTWSCYEGQEYQCGTCGTCIDRKEAFRLNGVEDPVPYKD